MDSILLLSQNRGNIIPYCLSLFPFHSLPPLSSRILSALQLNFQLGWSIFLSHLSLPLNAGAFLFFFGPFCGCQSLTTHEHTLPKDHKQRVEGQAAGILQRIHSATP